MQGELRLRDLSEITSQLYVGSVKRFSQYFGKSPAQLGPEEFREFLLHLVHDRKATASTVQLYRSALKFLYVTTLKQKRFDEDVAKIGRLSRNKFASECTGALRVSDMKRRSPFVFSIRLRNYLAFVMRISLLKLSVSADWRGVQCFLDGFSCCSTMKWRH
jgi:hypothetical protein